MKDYAKVVEELVSHPAEERGMGHTAVAGHVAWLRDNGYVVRLCAVGDTSPPATCPRCYALTNGPGNDL